MGAAQARLSAGEADLEFSGVSIDTRTLAPGELFVAIRGERLDGAEFAEAALEKGALGVVVPRGRFTGLSRGSAVGASDWRPAAGSPVVIEVDDTTLALQSLASAVRRASGATVIAITGSAGKTTTKEVTAEVLAARYRVIRNRGNFNNHIGLPLSLIELRHRPEIAVVELGMNHAGEISTLVRIAEPDVRVWTNVGDAHIGFFGSVDRIADAKAEILERATPSTVLVANADDDRIAARTVAFGGRVVTFGIDRDADVRATDVVDSGIHGTVAQVTASDGTVKRTLKMTVPLVGRANLSNVLAAAAVALELRIPLGAVVERVAHLAPAPHRGEIVRLPSGVTIVDDSYNANPSATKSILEVIARTDATRRVAVLGEMLELGDHALRLHEETGRAAASSRLDLLFVVGGDAARALGEAAVAAGMPRQAVRYFQTSDDAAPWIASRVERGDLVLVKGSRGVRTDRIVERLKAERG